MMRLLAEISVATRIPMPQLREYTPAELQTVLAVLNGE